MRRVTFLGGPRDGDIINEAGHRIRVPVPRPITYVPDVDYLPLPGPSVVEYVARQDIDGRWFYVIEGYGAG
jgi:hypothetical protein